MLVVHRGFRTKNSENRMFNFIKALTICKVVEFDIRLTKDKKPYFHDHQLGRFGHKNISLRNTNYEKIKNLPYFHQQKEDLPPLFVDDFTKKLAEKYQMINVEIE